MSYSVEHVRYTLECDACGRTEKRDLDAGDQEKGTKGWGNVFIDPHHSSFCCPDCREKVAVTLRHSALAIEAARAAEEAACEHDYQSCGFLMKCMKCKRYR